MNGTKARPPQDAAVLLRPERDAVASWLLGAAKDFDEAQCQWEEFGIALLACGGVFSVVRLTDTLVHTAAGSTEPAEVDAFLRMSLDGPTFVDTYSGVYYVLVPTGVEQRWCLSHPPDVEFLGRNSYLGVPAPERTDPAQTRWHWCVPMDSPGRLCAPAVVWQVVRAGYRPVEESGW